MRILLDNCLPHQLRSRLSNHHVETAGYRGWARLANGALLTRAEPEYAILITADQNLRYQQNIATRRIGLIILPTNKRVEVMALLPEIQQAIADSKPGSFIEIPRHAQ